MLLTGRLEFLNVFKSPQEMGARSEIFPIESDLRPQNLLCKAISSCRLGDGDWSIRSRPMISIYVLHSNIGRESDSHLDRTEEQGRGDGLWNSSIAC